MATAIPIKYALDLTGVSNDNLIVGEIQTLAEKKYKILAPKYAPFFAEGFNLWDDGTNEPLIIDTDFKLIEPSGMSILQTGKMVYCLAVITKKSTTNRFRYDYQTVGGGYHASYEAVRQMLDNASNDTRPVDWPNVENRPEVFAPSPHYNSIGNAIGFEYLVNTLDRLRDTLLLGDTIGHDEILLYLQSKIQALTALLSNDTTNGLLSSALTRASSALLLVNKSVTDSTSALQASVLSLEKSVNTQNELNDLRNRVISDNSDAQALLSSYPAAFSISQSNGTYIDTPPLSGIGPLIFPTLESIGTVSTDYYTIMVDGGVKIGSSFDSNLNSQAILKLGLKTSKPMIGGQAQLEISISVMDQRNSSLLGKYGSNCSVELLPIVFDDGQHERVSVFASTADYVFTETPKDGRSQGASFIIDGIDTQSTSLVSTTIQHNLNANRIAQYLLDCRTEYNIQNYGMIPKRKGVIFSIPTGGELKLTFKLSGASVEEIRKRVCVLFKQHVNIYEAYSPGSGVSTRLIQEGPDTAMIRCLSGHY